MSNKKKFNPEEPDKLHATAFGSAPKVWKHWLFAGVTLAVLLIAAAIFN